MSPKGETEEIDYSASEVLPPPEFDFTKPECWPQWLAGFERYILKASLTNKSNLVKINTLCYLMGEESEDIIPQVLPEGLNGYTKYEVVKSKFNEYFETKKNVVKNVVFERFKFNSRTQHTGESVDSFVADLYALAETCDFGVHKDDFIRDRIVAGIGDSLTSRCLQLLLEDVTVTRAIEVARQAEAQNKKKAQEEYKSRREMDRKLDWERLEKKCEIHRKHLKAVIDAISTRPSTSMQSLMGSFEIPVGLRTIHSLVVQCISLGRYEEAVPLCRHFLRDVAESCVLDHPDVAAMLALLARVYQGRKRYEEAEELLNDALAIRVKNFGENHPAVASTLNNFAELYGKQGNFEEAELMCKRGLEIREKLLGQDHPDVAKSLTSFATLCELQGKYVQAERYSQRAKDMCEAKYNLDDAMVVETKTDFPNWYTKQEKNEATSSDDK